MCLCVGQMLGCNVAGMSPKALLDALTLYIVIRAINREVDYVKLIHVLYRMRAVAVIDMK